MRHPAVAMSMLILLAACAAGSSGRSATLILKDPEWKRVTVEAVVTKSSDCARVNSYVATHKFVMTKGQTHAITAPNAENICWRHDSNPDNPAPGAWSGWSRATMFPGQTVETDL
jgi:hypothetical protein